MKRFFMVMLIASVGFVIHGLWDGLNVMAHNQYEGRHDLLDTNHQQQEDLSAHLGLTQKELQQCDRRIADAYKQSVYDGYKLGTAYSRQTTLYFVIAGLLFVTSCLAIRGIQKN